VRGLVDGARVVLALRRVGLRALVGPARTLPPAPPSVAREVARAVDAGLGVLPVRVTCLRRSMTLLRELRRQGLDADLCLGVRRAEHGVEAHAWLEIRGEVVNDDPAEVRSYAALGAGDAERLLRAFL
jgi:hypothetical protein